MKLMASATGSGPALMNSFYKHISEYCHVLERGHNAGSHHAFRNNFVVIDQRSRLISYIRECQSDQRSGPRTKTKSADAKCLWHMIRVDCRREMRLCH